jgi:MerR family transcriptional regulator, light-induced transcriptional regulator
MKTLEKQTADAIYFEMPGLSAEISKQQQYQRHGLASKYGLNEQKFGDYEKYNLHQLAEALIANDPQQFARYILWQRSMLRGRQIQDCFVELNLATEQGVLAKVLTPEFQPVISRFMKIAREALNGDDNSNQSFIEATGKHSQLTKQYLDLLLAGDREKGSELINQAITSGVSIRDIYLDVFKSCLYEVGRLWQTGQITVAHEHFFSAATQMIISELYPQIRKLAPKNGKVAIAACVSGELHEIGLRMSTDILEMEGWQTFYLGANMPALSIIDMIKEKKAQVLILSCCLPISAPALRELISTVKETGEGVKVIIGGYTISNNPIYAATFGTEAATDAGEVVNLANCRK